MSQCFPETLRQSQLFYITAASCKWLQLLCALLQVGAALGLHRHLGAMRNCLLANCLPIVFYTFVSKASLIIIILLKWYILGYWLRL